jgi:large conductance mechanosensitive channel
MPDLESGKGHLPPKARETIVRPIKEVRGLASGFQEFLVQYNVIPLAIGVVMGSALNDFVKTFVDGMVSPIISLVTSEGKLQTLVVMYHGSSFKIGAVLNSLISFLVVALVVYLVIKVIIRKDEYLKKP